MNYVIGAGGVGSWLLPSLCLLKDPKDITVVDGDTLEKKNLNRQLFTVDDIGKNKADALAARYGCVSVPAYYSHGMMQLNRNDWLFCCVDNNPGRRAVLDSCDTYGCKAVFGANEVHSSEAYYYEREWRGKPADPRVYYPDIATGMADDPRHAAIGCTGEVQQANRQLVSANFMAAALMQHLYVIWGMERRNMGKEALIHLPIQLKQNLTRNEMVRLKERQ